MLFNQKQPAVEEKSQALEATLVPAVDQGQENENSEVFVVEKAQELATSNAVPDEAKDAQPEQLAPGVLEISAQVYALCIFFFCGNYLKTTPPHFYLFFPDGAKMCGCFGILWKGSTTASRPKTSLYVLE